MRTFWELPPHARLTMTYAGIGNRDIDGKTEPVSGKPLGSVMTWVAGELERIGYTLNSGGASGSDAAFEAGVADPSHKNIFRAGDATNETRLIAREMHPTGDRLGGYVLDLFARNTFQVFGIGLDTPVDFVLCYTRDGCESQWTRTAMTGGTGQAIEMAARKGSEIFNMKNRDWLGRLNYYLQRNGLVSTETPLEIPGDLK